MDRFFLAASFVMTGFFPLLFGLYLAYKGDYFVSVGCILTSVCGFQQVYHNLKNQELFDVFATKILEQQAELELHEKNNKDQRKDLTKNLADLFGMKMEEQQKKLDEQQQLLEEQNKQLARHRSELMKAAVMLEQKNKEIWKLRDYNYD